MRPITTTILSLAEHLHQQHSPSSFPNLYATVLHMWDAESAWWQRVHKHEKVMMPSQNFNPTMKEATNGLLSQSGLWTSFADTLAESALKELLTYKNIRGEEFQQPLHEIILHVFNHSTYHRGQLVTIMRSLGHETIPQTDFIIWSRKYKRV